MAQSPWLAPFKQNLNQAGSPSVTRNAADAVDHLSLRLLSVTVNAAVRNTLVTFLERQLGTADLAQASTYMERPLRLTAHLIMSSPEFQLC